MNGNTQSRKGHSGGRQDEAREVLDAIRRLTRSMRLSSQEAQRAIGVNGPQLLVLQKLAEADGVLSVNDIADRTHTHQSSVSVMLSGLEGRGLVTRKAAADDRRRLDVGLTPQAKSILRKSTDAAQDRLTGALSRMPAAARRELTRGLARLVEQAGIADQPVEA